METEQISDNLDLFSGFMWMDNPRDLFIFNFLESFMSWRPIGRLLYWLCRKTAVTQDWLPHVNL